MNGYQKTGFQQFRETKAAPPVGIAVALLLSILLVWGGFYTGMLDGIIIAILAYFILRFFRAKRLPYMMVFALCLLVTVTAFKVVTADNADIFDYLYITSVVLVVPFVLLAVLTWWMRNNLEKTRARMEAEGRLYPQGYGRCKRCGTIVLPGEISCRKCGEYIDVPEELRVKKVNYFECSECGREVPEEAGVCPYCGEVFEDDTDGGQEKSG